MDMLLKVPLGAFVLLQKKARTFSCSCKVCHSSPRVNMLALQWMMGAIIRLVETHGTVQA